MGANTGHDFVTVIKGDRNATRMLTMSILFSSRNLILATYLERL